tara:strand:+ start:529 stop:723 length:195 start_codon:yes stop_codon:yes gene_type:complete
VSRFDAVYCMDANCPSLERCRRHFYHSVEYAALTIQDNGNYELGDFNRAPDEDFCADLEIGGDT